MKTTIIVPDKKNNISELVVDSEANNLTMQVSGDAQVCESIRSSLVFFQKSYFMDGQQPLNSFTVAASEDKIVIAGNLGHAIEVLENEEIVAKQIALKLKQAIGSNTEHLTDFFEKQPKKSEEELKEPVMSDMAAKNSGPDIDAVVGQISNLLEQFTPENKIRILQKALESDPISVSSSIPSSPSSTVS